MLVLPATGIYDQPGFAKYSTATFMPQFSQPSETGTLFFFGFNFRRIKKDGTAGTGLRKMPEWIFRCQKPLHR